MRFNKNLRFASFLAVITTVLLLIIGCTPNIGKLKERQDVGGLIKALGYESDSAVRQAAADALVEIGEPAVEPLINSLNNGNKFVQRGAAGALKKIKSKES